MNSIFNDIGFDATKKGLDVSSLRNKVIAQNISNVSTPGYSASKVKFEELLDEKLGFKLAGTRTNQNHLPVGRANNDIHNINPVVEASTAPIPAGKVNNIEIDKEIVELAKNSLNWDTYVNLISFKYRLLSASIRRQ
ncbi:MAG: flagellar basal body rod protein FlgB [bacterium]|nr:flagellar basal body rod protein FlgB [bacterium]